MDAIDGTTTHVLAVIFVATLVRSAFGFGEALIAVPLLALVLPVEIAAPLAVLVSITVAGVVVAQDWQQVEYRSAKRLVVSTLPGIPLGLLLLVTAPESLVKSLLAILIFAFSSYSLLKRQPTEFHDDRWAWLFGFAAGVLGGAYGMNGPPLVVYGALRRWSPQQFRATLQGYFLPASLVGMVGYWLAGLWVATVTRYYLISLPIALAAIFLGRAINKRIDGRRFLQAIHVALILIALVLLTQSLWPPSLGPSATPSDPAPSQPPRFRSLSPTVTSGTSCYPTRTLIVPGSERGCCTAFSMSTAAGRRG